MFKNLTHTYMQGSAVSVTAVHDIDFTIEDGEIFSVIGHTGSGKSTLVQHINGILQPTGGSVTVNGLTLDTKANRAKVRQFVGMMFQYPEYQLFDETVYKDIAFGPTNTGVPADEIEAHVRAAMAQTGLDFDKYAQKSPFELSGGEKRRVAIAGILASSPKVLVLDEPIAGLDPRGRSETLRLIQELNQSGMTIVLISHNMEDVFSLSTRVAVLSQGRLLRMGTPREVFEDSEQLLNSGLDVPASARLALKLREKGLPVPQDCLEADEIIRYLRGVCNV